MSTQRKLLSLRDAAVKLGVAVQQVRRAINRGTIHPAEGPDVPNDRLLGRYWFTEEEVERYDAARKKLKVRGRVRKSAPEKGGRRELQRT
jgi:hypothetical protein